MSRYADYIAYSLTLNLTFTFVEMIMLTSEIAARAVHFIN